jgi:hypothetical protein
MFLLFVLVRTMRSSHPRFVLTDRGHQLSLWVMFFDSLHRGFPPTLRSDVNWFPTSWFVSFFEFWALKPSLYFIDTSSTYSFEWCSPWVVVGSPFLFTVRFYRDVSSMYCPYIVLPSDEFTTALIKSCSYFTLTSSFHINFVLQDFCRELVP